jgi:hypothetical protein
MLGGRDSCKRGKGKVEDDGGMNIIKVHFYMHIKIA